MLALATYLSLPTNLRSTPISAHPPTLTPRPSQPTHPPSLHHLSPPTHPHSTPLLCADASGVLRVNATSLHWQLLDSAEPTTVLDEMLLSR